MLKTILPSLPWAVKTHTTGWAKNGTKFLNATNFVK